mmetsp:Transcript_11812/g.33695  ORF Transcript_11812/g.33695 Transcript_11812/m.33695 type:complete len:559 (+) Transcript_11812:178-1854(+)
MIASKSRLAALVLSATALGAVAFSPQSSQALDQPLAAKNRRVARPRPCCPRVRGGGGGGGAARPRPMTVSAAAAPKEDNGEQDIFRGAVAVGAATAAMGFAYGKVLDLTVRGVWEQVPALLAARGVALGGGAYIAATMAAGGLVMGLLSAGLKPAYIVAEFVSNLSGSRPTSLPSLLPALPNLLLLSLVTSTFGFSVGPEAPMVCAGGLVGAALARKWCSSDDEKDGSGSEVEGIMAYAGAAGSLTAFMGIPLAGPIFALELTRASAGMASAARDALGPAVAASVAALVIIRGILLPRAAVGGHFSYGAVGALGGRAAMSTALACGLGGAIIGTGFHKLVHLMKGILWTEKATCTKKEKGEVRRGIPIPREVVVKTLVGVAVGLLSAAYPQTMFWGEGSLQTAVDGQKTAFIATRHGLSTALTSVARVDPSIPFQSGWEAAQVGSVKLLSIALACAGKFPGGIIFPLFFAAAPLAQAALSLLPMSFPAAVSPVAVMCLMASTQASVTRTPLATILMLALGASTSTEITKMLPSVILSSYLGVYFSRLISKESYFSYST